MNVYIHSFEDGKVDYSKSDYMANKQPVQNLSVVLYKGILYNPYKVAYFVVKVPPAGL